MTKLKPQHLRSPRSRAEIALVTNPFLLILQLKVLLDTLKVYKAPLRQRLLPKIQLQGNLGQPGKAFTSPGKKTTWR